jgi:amino acid adenylation domain-containing protein
MLLDDGAQEILPSPVRQEIPVLNLRGSTTGGADELARVRAEMAEACPGPGQWPLWDIRISRWTGATRLHIGFDLLTADLASVRIVLADWLHWYEEPDWAPQRLSLSFRDYVLAEPDREHDERMLAYWCERFDELPAAPQLPQATPTENIQRPRFHRREARLPSTVWQAIRESARERGVTPAAVLLAAFSGVLARWSSEPDVTVGVTKANRRYVHPEVDLLVGDFTAVLPVAVHTGEPDFTRLAQSVHRRLADDSAHVPSDGMRILRELTARRGDPGGAPLPVVFTSGLGLTGQEEPGVFFGFGTQGYMLSRTPQVALDHQVFEDRGELVVSWDVVDDLYPPGMVDAAFEAYTTLLGELAELRRWSSRPGPELPLAQRQVRDLVNDTAGALPDDVLWSAVAERGYAHPQVDAVYAPDRAVSYGELVGRAVLLAHRLRRGGAGPGEVVAVRLPKGWRQLVAVLGATAAGAIYLPVDPDLPESRQQWLIEHAGAAFEVSEVELDTSDWRHADVAGWNCPAKPDDVAYIIYTSGSTGSPKGVAVTHRAALNTLEDVRDRFGIGPTDTAFGLSALSFDLSVFDIFGMLGAGGRLVLPGGADRRNPARWVELARRHRVTVWNSVPALASMLDEYLVGRTDERLPLRLFLLSGDWLPLPLPDRLRERVPGTSVVSLGGATEASVWSIHYPVGEVDRTWDSIPYGVPLRNQSFFVLDERMEDRPDHVPGELYIGGAGVAECYWNDPDRTAASFVTHPVTGQRLYRTGDLGRYRPDGVIEFLGRRDFQVKIGGFRIECGEVEHHLQSHPSVADAVVTAVGSRHHLRLAAFVRPSRADLEGMQARLRQPGVREVEGDGVALSAHPRSRSRRSHRIFETEQVPFERICALLSALVSFDDEDGRPTRHYGSAGGLYPVQVYLIAAPGRVEDLPGGAYYHDPRDHRLRAITEAAHWPLPGVLPESMRQLGDAPFALVLAAQHRAIQPSYGSRSRDFCLLEAGAIAHLLETAGNEAGLGLCQVGGTDADALRDPLALDDDYEPLHVLVAGTPVTPAPDTTDLPTRLTAYLAQRLPNYMVPSSITTIGDFPLTPQGKVDRGALARGSSTTPIRRAPAVVPETRMERTVVDAVAAVLDVGVVGATDRFFDLGATSVDLTRLYRRLHEVLGSDASRLSLLTLFEHPTPRMLAHHLLDTARSQPDDALEAAVHRAQARTAARRRTNAGGTL